MKSFKSELKHLPNDLKTWILSSWNNNPHSTSEFAGIWSPSMDVIENEKTLIILADIPGADPKDLQIYVNHNVLTISGEKHRDTEQKEEEYNFIERFSGKFYRTFKLPINVTINKVSAKMEKGVLKIILPKSQPFVSFDSKKIEIE